MTVETLPSEPVPDVLSWDVVDFGGVLQGALGGAKQRVNRLGNRWMLRASIPAMDLDDGRAWSAALAKGLQNGVLYEVRQPGLTIGSPGAPRVAGGGQFGNALVVDGFTAAYTVQAGQFFSLIASGQRYLHQAATAATMNGAGAGTIELVNPLRISPADNSVLEFETPYIQGLLQDAPSWFFQTGRIARGFSFTIEEAR